jgi:uncharacterized protein (DUF362 family)
MVNDVWIQKLKTTQYPEPPFSPMAKYPELTRLPYNVKEMDPFNEIYEAVREVLIGLGFDKEHFGNITWNPLAHLVKPGQMVVLKPNFVRGRSIFGEKGALAIITQAAIFRPIIDYVLLATMGNVRIVIGDAPIRTSDWEIIVSASHVRGLLDFYKEKEISIDLIDFRKDLVLNNKFSVYEKTVPNPTRNENDYIKVNIGLDSMLQEIMNSNNHFDMGGVKYGTIKKYHTREKNLYLLPKEILEADLLINVPKLKSHRMTGLTCAMKNLIGINGDKSYIAHYRRGVKSDMSDEFEKFSLPVWLRERIWTGLKTVETKYSKFLMTLIKRFVQATIWKGRTFEEVYASTPPKLYREGGWSGNDTVWRCIVDLNRIIKYTNKNGKMTTEKQRNCLCIADAVIAGEGEGPLAITPKPIGIIFGAENSVYMDYAAAKIMRFNVDMMPMISKAFADHVLPIVDKHQDDISIQSNVSFEEYSFDFIPTSGWRCLIKHRVG